MCLPRGNRNILDMDALMTKQDLGELLVLGKTALTALTHREDFPAAIRINARTLRWEKQAVHAWLEANKTDSSGESINRIKRKRGQRTFTVDGVQMFEVQR